MEALPAEPGVPEDWLPNSAMEMMVAEEARFQCTAARLANRLVELELDKRDIPQSLHTRFTGEGKQLVFIRPFPALKGLINVIVSTPSRLGVLSDIEQETIDDFLIHPGTKAISHMQSRRTRFKSQNWVSQKPLGPILHLRFEQFQVLPASQAHTLPVPKPFSARFGAKRGSTRTSLDPELLHKLDQVERANKLLEAVAWLTPDTAEKDIKLPPK